ncbi:hypothetical protein KEG38_50360 [Polyangium jinanense]|uniref:hypothetical protein n=1 Tax=Polyangium jinanense TaxID=2829994 RepID=UPI002340A894|nr:hypothetical protein [Polyangium jinanense]MDC3962123.1 hypothetical protein [Polyangium jinanense]
MKSSIHAVASMFVVAAALTGCGKGEEAVVRVQVPEVKAEVAIPGNMEIKEASASGFWVVPKGKDKFDGMLVAVTPVAPMGNLAPPDAQDVKVDKDQKNPDGSAAREGSYKTAVQTFYVAEYAYPIGKDWLHCNIKAAKVERRDEAAKICRVLAPKAL